MPALIDPSQNDILAVLRLYIPMCLHMSYNALLFHLEGVRNHFGKYENCITVQYADQAEDY